MPEKPAKNSKIVVIIDRHPSDAALLRHAFEQVDGAYQVRSFSTASDALLFSETMAFRQALFHADVILINPHSGETEREMLTSITADPLLDDIPVIVCSQSLDLDSIMDAHRHDILSYMKKPSSFGEAADVAQAVHLYLTTGGNDTQER